MNLLDLKQVLERGFARDDLRSEYPNYIRDGLRTVQQDANWFCMRHSQEVVIPSGSFQVSLPADFKEFTPARPPVFMKADDAIAAGGAKWLPCDVVREEELDRRSSALLLPRRLQTLTRRGPDIFLTTDGVGFQINIIDQLTGNATFRVSYFRFLPDLQADTDRNYLTENYHEMVKNKIKSVAFEDVQDPVAADFEKLYEIKKTKAQASDSRRWIVGRKLQMGG